jgi:Ser/Thr protein kinase RdoA (MazF antagonist)
MEPSRAQAEATRLLPLAQRVLEQYSFLTREVTHLATHSNVLYRVVTESGEQRVLRVGTPHGNTRSNIEVEVAWLDAIDRETGLDVVKPLQTAGGSLIVDEYDDGIDKERSCVVFSWIPGQPMADGSGTFAYRLLGTMAASLQAHGRSWTPPVHVEMRQWDRVFYYQDFDPIIIDNPVYGHLFDMPRLATINRALGVAEDVISDSYSISESQVVHGDLHEWNVHVAGSRLYALDFEDVMMALPAQDVATCLYSSRNSEIKEQIRAAFQRGYESVLPWPVIDERQLDGFHAARQIMLMNYAARTLRMEEATDYIDHVMPWLERYVERYG